MRANTTLLTLNALERTVESEWQNGERRIPKRVVKQVGAQITQKVILSDRRDIEINIPTENTNLNEVQR